MNWIELNNCGFTATYFRQPLSRPNAVSQRIDEQLQIFFSLIIPSWKKSSARYYDLGRYDYLEFWVELEYISVWYNTYKIVTKLVVAEIFRENFERHFSLRLTNKFHDTLKHWYITVIKWNYLKVHDLKSLYFESGIKLLLQVCCLTQNLIL